MTPRQIEIKDWILEKIHNGNTNIWQLADLVENEFEDDDADDAWIYNTIQFCLDTYNLQEETEFYLEDV